MYNKKPTHSIVLSLILTLFLWVNLLLARAP